MGKLIALLFHLRFVLKAGSSLKVAVGKLWFPRILLTVLPGFPHSFYDLIVTTTLQAIGIHQTINMQRNISNMLRTVKPKCREGLAGREKVCVRAPERELGG